MPMSAAVLADELLNLDPVATEAEAVVTLADAYATFASFAQAGPSPITPLAVETGKAAMAVALVGLSVPGAGAAKLTAGVLAFWTAVAAGLATSFAGAIAITPPPNAGLTAALTSAFNVNTATKAPKETATQLIAAQFYAQAIILGTVTYPPSTIVPIL